jgi:hypothetical protein
VTATDPAGNAATSAERCAGVPFEDRSLAGDGPATQVDDPAAFQGTITQLTGAGAQVTLSFTGRRIGALFQRCPDGGRARIFLDGVAVKTVDTYATSVIQRRYLWSATVPYGSHEVRVAWTGKRNIHSAGTDVAVDGVAVIGGDG